MGALQDLGQCDQHRNSSQPKVVLRTGGDSGDRLCLLSDRGAGFPTVDCPRAARGARPRARSCALMGPEPPLICCTGLMPGTTTIQPQACTNFGTSTSTGLDSHVASNCRFGKQVATAFRKNGVGQCLAGEHRMTLPRMYRFSHQGLRVDRAGPARAGLATPHRYKLSGLGLTERSQRRAPTTRSFLRGAALQAPPFGSCIANAPGGRHARCAKRASR